MSGRLIMALDVMKAKIIYPEGKRPSTIAIDIVENNTTVLIAIPPE